MINRFGHVSFRTGYAAMRCFKSCCFNDLKLANLFDDKVPDKSYQELMSVPLIDTPLTDARFR